MFSSHTLVQKGEVFIGNSVTSKVIAEGTIQFRSHDGCITSRQGVRYVPDQDTISSFLETYIEKGFVSIRKVILWKFSKETNVMFQADRVSNVYMLRNSEVTVGGLQLSLASKAVIVEQSEATMDSSLDVQLCPEGRLGLGIQQGSPDHYSYGGAKFS